MFAGGCVIVAGTAIVASAHKIEQLIGGRFVLGWGIAIMTVAAPRSVHVHCFQDISAHRFPPARSYCVEIAPPHWRGKFVGFYNCGWFGGKSNHDLSATPIV
jgi:MFS family permease